MPARTTRRDEARTVRIGLQPDGSGGLGSLGVDLYTRQGLLSDLALRRGERVRIQDGALTRAKGPKRLHSFTNNTGARTFGATTIYASVATASQLLIPAGSWGVRCSFVATRPSAGNTAYILSSRPAAVAWHVLRIILSDAGVTTVEWRDSGGSTRSVACSAVSAGATVHLLAVFDAVEGTFTVYIDGASSGTPLTGLASSLKPDQTATDWVFGVEKQTGAAVTANTNFDGALDAFTLFTFRGIRIATGDPSMLDTLLAHTFRQWPNPALPCVLAHYDFDEASGTTLYDRSKHKNHGTYTGASTAGSSVALAFPVGNYAGVFQKANGSRINLFGAGGSLFYQVVRSGA